ncbi:MAG TPA: tetrahydrofolate dehydrogenase/cyclohydrolase catalytic domain-containing protein [Chitinophagaceae bacterium]|nr:tetrahydrofolate dehydrogenase/cyclohydrolase catalytic domain-containing protein [Chitinophagaceae bacterium]
MQILDGKKAAQALKDDLRIDVAQRSIEGKKIPHLAAILVGHNGASETYVAAKVKACEETGFKSTLIRFDETISENKLLEKIEELNLDTAIDGILVQLKK